MKLSQYKGVSRFTDKVKRKKPWIAQITVRGWTHRVGYFATEEEAAAAYVRAVTYWRAFYEQGGSDGKA